jgi:hypothetical protein
LIAAMRIHYKTKTTTVYFTGHFTVHFVGVVQGDIEIYNNINSGVVRGIHKSTTTTLRKGVAKVCGSRMLTAANAAVEAQLRCSRGAI